MTVLRHHILAAVCLLPILVSPLIADNPRQDRPCVVLLHGLLRTSRSMDWIGLDLRRKGYRVIAPDYATTRHTVQEHAEWLRSFIDELPCDSVFLVTHSLASLIAREYLSTHQPAKVKKLVMITPPNHGAEKADRYRGFFLYHWVFGKVAYQVTSDSVSGTQQLGIPHCPFAILAGGKSKEGYAKDIPGNDDGVLSVEKTYLEGTQDFLVIKASHNGILRKKETSDNIISFLLHGRFLNQSPPPNSPHLNTKRKSAGTDPSSSQH